MIDPITAAAAATKAYAGVRALIEAGRSIEDTFQAVSRWQGHCSDVLYASQRHQKKRNPFQTIVFSKSVEAEAAQIFAAKKKVEQQRKELITLLKYAYGNEGVAEYRKCVKDVTEQRQREVYAQQEARDTAMKSMWIVVLTGLAGWLISIIVKAVNR